MHSSDESDLGPLPSGSREMDIERLGVRAIKNTLIPFVQELRYRDERADDTGVDLSLEVLVNGRPTNLRSHVQLKSTDHPSFRSDGTVALPVKTSNLNYLLNGPSPMYILYLAKQDELRYVWAGDERKRIEAINPAWSNQKTITLRFVDTLTPAAINSVRQRVLREGRFVRKIHEELVRAPVDECLTISLDTNSLEIIDDSEAARTLMESGLTLVSAGKSKQVSARARRLPPQSQREPRVHVVVAYADYMQGKYHSALAHIGEALLHQNELSRNDRDFLLTLKNVCDYRTGRLTQSEYLTKQEILSSKLGGPSRLYHRLEEIRYRTATVCGVDEKKTLFEELYQLVAETLADDAISKGQKLQARLHELQFRSWEVQMKALQVAAQMRLGVIPASGVIGSDGSAITNDAIAALTSLINAAVVEAKELGNPVFMAEALSVRLQIWSQGLIAPFLAAVVRGNNFTLPEDQLTAMEANFEAAVGAFAAVDILDRKLETRMFKADIYEMLGRHDDAVAIAGEVLPIAQAMEYVKLVEWASEMLQGRSIASDCASQLRDVLQHQDRRWAEMTGDQVCQSARDGARTLGLSDARAANLEKDYFATRAAAQERTRWCRHIQLVQNTGHRASAATLYARDPDQKWVCAKHGYRTRIETPYWQVLLQAFKQEHCGQCEDREVSHE